MTAHCDIQASLYFIAKDSLYSTEKPYILKYAPETTPNSNYVTKRVDNISVKDLRDIEESFVFENNGFAVLRTDSAMGYDDFENEEKILNVYFKEIAEALLHYTHGVSVHLFDFLVRRTHSSWPSGTVDANSTPQPAMRTHIDVSPEAAKRMATMFENQNLHQLSNGRPRKWIYINIWKPLKGPLHDWPLAVCDAKFVDGSDLIAADVVSMERVLETMAVHYNPNQRWYYLSNQQPNELLIFRQADSEGRQGTPHTAFFNTAAPASSITPRESIEARCIIFLE